MAFFEVGGRRLFYRERGEGPLLLILPGNTATSACHLGEMEYFSKHYHAVSMDFWGTGQSDRVDQMPLDWFNIAAADAMALVEHLNQEKTILVGTSGGGIVALLAAIQFPDKVRAVIADSTPEHFDAQSLEVFLAERSQRSEGQIQFWSNAQGQDWQQVIDADTDLLRRIARRSGDFYEGRLNEIICPVIFTASLQDDAIPNIEHQVSRMAAQIPNSQVYFANQGGHPLMWSKPSVFRQIADFFFESGLAEHDEI